MNNFKKASSAFALVSAVAFSVVAYGATNASLGTAEVVSNADLPAFSLEEQMSADFAIRIKKKTTTKTKSSEEKELEVEF